MSVRSVRIHAGDADLDGDLTTPAEPRGLVIFAHGSGSGRHSPRNQYVARELNGVGFATLLIDLLTSHEETIDAPTGHLRFDIDFLARRLIAAADWAASEDQTASLPIGLFGASTGAAAALIAATERRDKVHAVVSRGGRPDLADDKLPQVQAPTLLLVGGLDGPVVGMNERAIRRLGAEDKRMEIISGATHLFQEPGKLEEVARLAAAWFAEKLSGK